MRNLRRIFYADTVSAPRSSLQPRASSFSLPDRFEIAALLCLEAVRLITLNPRPKLLFLAAVVIAISLSAEEIPSPWSAASIAGYRLPLAGLGHAPKMISGAAYYALPEVNLKTYPVYTPEKEPKGYLEWLKSQTPEPLVDVSKLHSREDWIAAGKEVFDGRELPRFSGSEDNLALIRDPRVLAAYKLQTTKDGVLIGLRYLVREKGKVELGTDTCAMCHVRVQPDGSVSKALPTFIRHSDP